jgi:co-chaperonin GroES (HSP10)
MKTTQTPKTDLVPRGKSVLIKQISLEQKTKSSIILAEGKNQTRPTGMLIACGPDCKQDLIDGIGSLVSFNPFSNLQLIDGYNNVYYFMEDFDIRCFITKDTIMMDANDEHVKRIDIDTN